MADHQLQAVKVAQAAAAVTQARQAQQLQDKGLTAVQVVLTQVALAAVKGEQVTLVLVIKAAQVVQVQTLIQLGQQQHRAELAGFMLAVAAAVVTALQVLVDQVAVAAVLAAVAVLLAREL